jgi:hypothetical protein
MNNINLGRVVLGGLLAGLVLNIGEFLLNHFVLATQMIAFLAEHKFKEPSGNFIAVAVGLTFLMGIVLVLVYAMIRNRLGAGVNTAIVAGLIGWFGVYLYTGIINGVLFGFTVNLIGISIAWGIVEYTLAAVVGAWVYKEA